MNRETTASIQKLEKLLNESESLTHSTIGSFIVSVRATYLTIFGEGSDFHKYMTDFKYERLQIGDKTFNDRNLQSHITKIRHSIERGIKHLKENNIVVPKAKNFLANMSTFGAICCLAPVAIFVFGIGFYFGQEKINKDNVELTNENKTLKNSLEESRDSLKILQSFKQDTTIKANTDTTHQQ